MDVYFVSSQLAGVFGSAKERKRRYGAKNAQLIAQRLDTLRFAANLEVMLTLPGRLHALRGDRAGTFSLRLDGGLRLLLEPAETPPPVKVDGGLDLKAIRSVVILDIVDYHD